MDENIQTPKLRVTWVIATLGAGGIGPVCRYAALAVAKRLRCECTLLSLHEQSDPWTDEESGVRFVGLGMPMDAPEQFLQWLRQNPQDVVITNDVSKIEPCFAFFPKGVIHVVALHDSGRRYLDVAVRNHRAIDGILCVARHIEVKLTAPLKQAGFQGYIGTRHNGADFPDPPVRSLRTGPLRLLFMGSLDPLIKGIFDLVPILERVNKMGVPVKLTIAGGRNDALQSKFRRRGLDHLVTWKGRVPHSECYRLAAESDVFLMTSRREPFGMVTIEAMSMGCVPIAYDIPSGSQEIIEPGKSGLLVPLGDYKAWAECIRLLHEDRRRLWEISVEAMKRARTHFNSENLAQGMGEFLRAVQTNARSHPPQRSVGAPSLRASAATGMSYGKLPPWFRGWLRNVIGSYPHFSWWLLNR